MLLGKQLLRFSEIMEAEHVKSMTSVDNGAMAGIMKAEDVAVYDIT